MLGQVVGRDQEAMATDSYYDDWRQAAAESLRATT